MLQHLLSLKKQANYKFQLREYQPALALYDSLLQAFEGEHYTDQAELVAVLDQAVLPAYLNKSQVQINLFDYPAALQNARKVLQYDPLSLKANWRAALSCVKMGMTAEAEQYLAVAVEKGASGQEVDNLRLEIQNLRRQEANLTGYNWLKHKYIKPAIEKVMLGIIPQSIQLQL